MATSIRAASIARDVAELKKSNRRTSGAIAVAQVPLPAKDRLVIATSGQPATWQLTALPYLGDLGSSLNLSLNGLELDEATDYSVDYTTGLVTFSAGQQALFKATPTPADVLTADYLTSDDLTAAALPAITGDAAFVAANSATSAGFVSSIGVPIPTGAAVGNVLVLAASMRGTQTFSTPAGWTLGLSNNDGTTELRAWTRVCQSGDPGSTVTITIAASGTEIPSAACLAYSGIDTSSPVFITQHQQDATTTSTWTAGALDCRLSTTQSMGVLIWGCFPAGSHPLTMPGGVTGRVDVSGASNSRMLAVADELLAAGTLQPGRVATPTSANPYITVDLALRGVV